MDKKKEVIFDLDINNYELNDLLELFNLKTIYDLEDLKIAKKIVLKMHPDKSKLLPEYFLFYSKAYKRLCSLYFIKNKNLQKIEETEYTKDIDEGLKNVLDKNVFIQENENFNKAFNEMFEKNNVDAYICGHEHDLQVIRPEKQKVTYFVSGAGSEVRPTGSMPGSKFSISKQGFMIFSVLDNKTLVQVVDYEGKVVHKEVLLK